jgi:drug/metabolite transporter (DMT)-like permease
VGCAIYYLVAAAPSDGLPSIALASFGLLGGGIFVGAVGLTGLVPFTTNLGGIAAMGTSLPWWVLLVLVGVLSTAIPYATSIAATEMLGSRLASFVGLLEVVAAALYAWLLLGEQLTVLQLLGGVLILAGIAFVRSERTADPDFVLPAQPASDLEVVPAPAPASADPAGAAPASTSSASAPPASTASPIA